MPAYQDKARAAGVINPRDLESVPDRYPEESNFASADAICHWRTPTRYCNATGAILLRDLRSECVAASRRDWTLNLIDTLRSRIRDMSNAPDLPDRPSEDDSTVSRDWLRVAIWYTYSRGSLADWRSIQLPVNGVIRPAYGQSLGDAAGRHAACSTSGRGEDYPGSPYVYRAPIEVIGGGSRSRSRSRSRSGDDSSLVIAGAAVALLLLAGIGD